MDRKAIGLQWKRLFEQKGATHLHYMAPPGTMLLIAALGILCYESRRQMEARGTILQLLEMLGSRSIADDYVQDRRDRKMIEGTSLHYYAPLYFGVFTPMQYVVTDRDAANQATNVAFAEVDIARVFEIEGVLYTNGNAASNRTQFYQGPEGIDEVDWRIVLYSSKNFSRDYKWRKSAEVLVPVAVPPECIIRYRFMTKEAADQFASQVNIYIQNGIITYSDFEIVYGRDHFYRIEGGKLKPNG